MRILIEHALSLLPFTVGNSYDSAVSFTDQEANLSTTEKLFNVLIAVFDQLVSIIIAPTKEASPTLGFVSAVCSWAAFLPQAQEIHNFSVKALSFAMVLL